MLRQKISIHALREEGDYSVDGAGRHRDISIHALREEGDTTVSALVNWWFKFLSTPSARRTTLSASSCLV